MDEKVEKVARDLFEALDKLNVSEVLTILNSALFTWAVRHKEDAVRMAEKILTGTIMAKSGVTMLEEDDGKISFTKKPRRCKEEDELDLGDLDIY